jgi:hypothetical protein
MVTENRSVGEWYLLRREYQSGASSHHIHFGHSFSDLSRYRDSNWTINVGTGHLGGTLEDGLKIKVTNATAVAANSRF